MSECGHTPRKELPESEQFALFRRLRDLMDWHAYHMLMYGDARAPAYEECDTCFIEKLEALMVEQDREAEGKHHRNQRMAPEEAERMSRAGWKWSREDD